MKKALIFCCLIACCCSLVFAGARISDPMVNEKNVAAMKAAKDEAARTMTRTPDRLRGTLDEGGETCTTAEVIGGLPYTDVGNTCEHVDNTDEVCPYTGSDSPDVTYSYTPTSTEIATLTLCGGITNYDTKLYVYENGGLYACNDDWCPNPPFYSSSYISQLDCITLTAGNTYCIVVDGYSGDCGDYTLAITECGAPTGRCCWSSEGVPLCDNVTEAECDVFGGTWTEGLDCFEDPCPVVYECTCLEGEWCNTTGGYIFDASTLTTTLDVGVEYHITDLNVCVDLDHTFLGDLDIWLVSPSGTIVQLWCNACGSEENLDCVTFDDEGINALCSEAPFSGYHLIPCVGPLSLVDGENAYGTWTLHIEDCCGADEGPLNWWCLDFEYDYILAVDFGSLAALPGDNSVTLNWNTIAETSNNRFEIIRDGARAAEIDATNSATGSSYSWTDANVTNGTTYTYTLVSVDLNGTRQELATVDATPRFENATVTEYSLHQNYPNPFNPETNISFDLVESGIVSLNVYNMLGQQVATLVNGSLEAGRHVVTFDATNLPSGIYMYRLEAGEFSAQMKMVLMK